MNDREIIEELRTTLINVRDETLRNKPSASKIFELVEKSLRKTAQEI
jgi:hypothetical protein